jgi:hypothetical protein
VPAGLAWGDYCRQRRCRLGVFQLADERDDMLAEILDLFLEVQEAEQDEIGAGAFRSTMRSAICLRRADQVRAEAVIVLDQIVEGGLRPIALAFRRRLAGILDLVAKGIDRLGIGLAMMSASTALASSSVSRTIAKALTPTLTEWLLAFAALAWMSSTCTLAIRPACCRW